MNTNNSKLTIWFLKNKYILIPFTILMYIISLFMAIIFRIDGLGIFSIAASIIFFTLLMYKKTNQRDADGGSGGGYGPVEANIENNASDFFNEILQPRYIHLILKIFTNIISYLKRNHEQLSTEEVSDLTLKLEKLNEELKQTTTKHQIGRPKNTPGN